MEKKVVNNYGSFETVFVKGKGSTLWDKDNKKYIDFISGIGCNALGHNYKPLVKAIQKQAAKEIHISNYYFSDAGLDFAQSFWKSPALKAFTLEIPARKPTRRPLSLRENTATLTAAKKEG